MLNPTAAPRTSFTTEPPQVPAPPPPPPPQHAIARIPEARLAPAPAPAVYLPAIKDFVVTSLPVPLSAALGSAITALAGVHYASDILAAAMFCATLLGVPGTFLMSRCLRNRQNDANANAARQPAQLPAPVPPKAD